MAVMQPIAEWLKKLGMSEYAERFAENGISVAALRHLTDQDLKDIGVLLGHRRIMLAAITELSGAAAAMPVITAAVRPTETVEDLRQEHSPASTRPTSISAVVEAAGEHLWGAKTCHAAAR